MLVTAAVVVLSAEDCVQLDRQLADAIRLGYLSRYARPPHTLLTLADQVHAAAEQYRTRPATPGSGTGAVPRTAAAPSSAQEQPVWLTVSEAAAFAQVSEGYVRRLARRGEVATSRKAGNGAWLIEANGLSVWMSGRTHHELREAA